MKILELVRRGRGESDHQGGRREGDRRQQLRPDQGQHLVQQRRRELPRNPVQKSKALQVYRYEND
jgi:hypothetical protein